MTRRSMQYLEYRVGRLTVAAKEFNICLDN
jgi:hypothetical protein